ncbi:hypothetical protein STEG23_027544 [Scotinomys teguina]
MLTLSCTQTVLKLLSPYRSPQSTGAEDRRSRQPEVLTIWLGFPSRIITETDFLTEDIDSHSLLCSVAKDSSLPMPPPVTAPKPLGPCCETDAMCNLWIIFYTIHKALTKLEEQQTHRKLSVVGQNLNLSSLVFVLSTFQENANSNSLNQDGYDQKQQQMLDKLEEIRPNSQHDDVRQFGDNINTDALASCEECVVNYRMYLTRG